MSLSFAAEKLIYFLLGIFIITIPCNNFLILPYFGDKIQLPEFVFLVTSVCFLNHFGIQKTVHALKNWHFTPIDKGILYFLGALILSALGHPTRFSILEVVGCIYLIALYVLLNLFFQNSRFKIIGFITQFFTISGLIAAIIGLTGWLMATFFQVQTILAQLNSNYPYLGDVYRVTAFTRHPIILASFTAICLLILAIKTRVNPKNLSVLEWFAVILMSIIEILTFTKAIVALGACALIVTRDLRFQKHRFLTPLINGIVPILLFIFVFFTHFIIIKSTKYDAMPLPKRHFDYRSEAVPYLKTGDFYVIRTTYNILKQTAYTAFKQNPLTGIGGGNFESFCDTQKTKGLYPTYLASFDPHSSYAGALSELGIIGFMALLYLIYTIFITFKRLITRTFGEEQLFVIGLGGILLFMASEATVSDIMNLRHYWVIVAALSILDRQVRIEHSH